MKKNIYVEKTANFPRLKTDKLFVDYDNTYEYIGFIDNAFDFVSNAQLMRTDLWTRFVQQFRENADCDDAGWRGEYWGKMMRGACFVYSYTKTPELYKILSETVVDILNTEDKNGRISTYNPENEFDGWDLWCRKYVLLGMQYFLEICADESLKKKIISSMCRQADYIVSKIGKSSDGKKEITQATRNWRGLNSSSILEPFIRLYNITGERKYFNFSKYIVDTGASDIVNIFNLAYENKLYPYQYPFTKAYEMTSCFEGLLEYYRVTGDEKYKKAVINFVDKILESDFTIIGGCGCTHELFDHSTVRQANTTNGTIMQETCVTVTLMKIFYQLTLMTGDSKYADAFEISFYNAYLGSVNTEQILNPDKLEFEIARNHKKQIAVEELHIEPLPFDSYSPLTAGMRGSGIGGFKIMSDLYYYGCCACIGSAGIGLVPKMALMSSKDGFAMNLYINGTVKSRTPKDNIVIFNTETTYPREGYVRISLKLESSEKFELLFRNPVWSRNTTITVNGKYKKVERGYISLNETWENGDVIELYFDMRTKALFPISYGSQVLMNEVVWEHDYVIPQYDEEDPIAKKHIALQRGPIILAQENRLGYSVEVPVSIRVEDDGYVEAVIPEKETAPYEHIVEVKVPLENGMYMTVTDYASAGKLWNEESKMAAWMLIK